MEKFRVKIVRNKEENISFYLKGVSVHCKDMSLCPDYIKNELKPRKFHYQYDFFDTFEEGYFVKDNILIKIYWSIYSGYDFEIDKYSTQEEIEKVKSWCEKIFQYLIDNESTEKKYWGLLENKDEDICIIKKSKKTFLEKLKSILGF